ncbi:MAG: CoB--CoM heterodisulfide reductase iron-sulfur subunit B family protein [Syntrophales bacterium]
MTISYYPGCTLKTKAKNLDDSGTASLTALGVDFKELSRWNCCGAVFSLADDDLLHLVAPVRDLVRVKEEGNTKVITACSMCYNTLARANMVMRDDEEKRYTINSFMEEEIDYNGEVDVFHYLTYLRDEIGWESLRKKVKKPLNNLKLAPYYGCTLVRPAEISIDQSLPKTIMQDFISALGAQPSFFPSSEECCSSYQIISNPNAALASSARILKSAVKRGADAIITSCPLCEYTLGKKQAAIVEKDPEVKKIPTFYFTQLLAVALGLEEDVCHFELNVPESRELLAKMNFV